MAAAVSAYDAGVRKIVIIEYDEQLGGILEQCVHTGFGLQEFRQELTGPEYALLFAEEVRKRDIECLLNTTVYQITQDKTVFYASSAKGYQMLKAKAIILSTGCRERTRDQIKLPGTRPAGIMTAGLAQRYINIDGFLPGKRVFILGSGDIGLIMARRMTLEGARVLGVAELMPYSNGLPRNIAQCLNDFGIPLYLSHTVTNIKGKERIEEVEISEMGRSGKIPGTEKYFAVDTLLLSVGLISAQELLDNLVILKNKQTKTISVSEQNETSIEGIFLCGNSLHIHDLVDLVTIEAKRVGKNIKNYLEGSLKRKEKVDVYAGLGVKYVIPNVVYLSDAPNEIEFSFRAAKPMHEVILDFKLNSESIYRKKLPHFIPSVMQKIKVKKELFHGMQGDLTVEARES